LKQPTRLEAPISERARWNLITELVGQAWDMDGTDRNAFLAQACDSDPALYAEVRALLAEQESVSYFLEGDVLEERLPKGAKLGSYIIEDKIGEGGMGVVYRGRDDRMGRIVAIKVVRFLGVPAQGHREQILHEARTTAALNHPNIVTIYDVGSTAGNDFIVMEYVEGRTLDKFFRDGNTLQLAEALRLGEQVLRALTHAHSKRIIHRDLKPGNIVVTENHGAKVLDFGLAKQLGQIRFPLDVTQATSSTMSNLTGGVAGTVSYMSPEQAEGAKVDERSDLFSFGCVLYEMITRKKAFHCNDIAETLVKIRKAEYRPARELVPDLPQTVDKLITDCLQLDPQRRPQSAMALMTALIKARVDAESRGKKFRYVIFGLLGAALVVSGWAGYRKYIPRPYASGQPPRALPLTGGGAEEFTPSISPDGLYVAYAAEEGQSRLFHIFVRPLQSGEPIALTAGAVQDVNPVWSPDGKRIAFLRVSDVNEAAVWIANRDDRTVRKLKNISPPIDWVGRHEAICWPENEWLIVSNRPSSNEPSSLYRLSVATGEEQRLTNPIAESEGDFSPQLSSDRRLLAFVRVSTWNNSSIYVQSLTRSLLVYGPLRRIDTGALQPSSVTWSTRGDLILTAGFADHTLWRVPLREGEAPQRLDIIGGDDGMNPCVSINGIMAFTRVREDAGVWRLDLRKKSARAPELLISSQSMNVRPQYSPDGQKISFISLRSGYAEIWMADSDGRGPTSITAKSDPSVGDPFWSPDGQSLVFSAAPAGQYDIYRIPKTGGAPVQITRDPSMDVQPSWSRDGRWIYFASNRAGAFHIYRVPSTGGKIIRVTEHPGYASSESPDGRFLYFTDTNTGIAKLWRLDEETGREESMDVEVYRRGFVPDREGIYFQVPGTGKYPEIWFLNLHNRRTRLIEKLNEYVASGLLSVSPDGRFLLFTKYRLESHIMVVKGFK
jgi:serine/threonine protein kinase/Tol biopolymer transport system component